MAKKNIILFIVLFVIFLYAYNTTNNKKLETGIKPINESFSLETNNTNINMTFKNNLYDDNTDSFGFKGSIENKSKNDIILHFKITYYDSNKNEIKTFEDERTEQAKNENISGGGTSTSYIPIYKNDLNRSVDDIQFYNISIKEKKISTFSKAYELFKIILLANKVEKEQDGSTILYFSFTQLIPYITKLGNSAIVIVIITLFILSFLPTVYKKQTINNVNVKENNTPQKNNSEQIKEEQNNTETTNNYPKVIPLNNEEKNSSEDKSPLQDFMKK